MKNYSNFSLFIIGLFISTFNSGFTQISNKDYNEFFAAVANKNDSVIARKGENILDELKSKKFKVDSSLIEIRIYTALSYYNLRNSKRSIELNTETYEILNKSSDFIYFQKFIACLHNLALAEEMQEQFEKALDWNLKSVTAIKNTIGSDNDLYFSELSNLASSYSDLNQDSIALPINHEVLSYLIKKGSDYKGIANTYNQISSNYGNIGDFLSALENVEKAMEVVKTNFGSDNGTYASYLHNCAYYNFELGRVNIAIAQAKEAVEIKKKIYGPYHGNYASSLSTLARYYSDIGNSKESLELKIKVAEISKKFYGENHSFYANALSSLAVEYGLQANYDLSLKFNHEALKIRELVLGPTHQDCAISLNNLANVYSLMGDSDKSIQCIEKAVEIVEKKIGKHSLQYAHVMNDLALEYSNKGDYQIALSINSQVLKIIESRLGKNNKQYATTLNNLAINYSGLGELNRSLEIYLEVLKIKRQIYGDSSINCVDNLLGLASIYSELGQFNVSLDLINEAKQIVSTIQGINHLQYAEVLFSLANNYFLQGKDIEALYYYKQALEIQIKRLGRKHPSNTVLLNNIAIIYNRIFNYKEAIHTNKAALKIRKKSFGIESLEYNVTLNNLAQTYYYMDRFKKSLRIFNRSLNIKEKLSQGFRNRIGISYINIAACYWQLGDTIDAFESLNKALSSFTSNFIHLSNKMPSEMMFRHKKELELVWLKTANLSIDSPRYSEIIYNKWILINGLLSMNFKQLETSIESEGKLKSKSDSLKVLKQNLNLELEKIGSLNIKQIGALKDSIILMELNLRKEYVDSIPNLTSSYIQELKSKITGDMVFVDIIKIPIYNFKNSKWKDSVQYLACISTSLDTSVDFVYIDNKKLRDNELLDEYLNKASNFNDKTELKDAIFYNSLWKPIADKIGDAKTVYVSLGGVYNNINLNTIYNPTTGKYLLEEKDIRIVNSAREFILNKERATKTYTNNTASLFGFPNFDGNTTVSAEVSDLFASTRDLNSFWLDSLTRGGLKAKPLPATKTEVENISATLKSKGWQVTNYLADNASETNLKTQQSPRVLHVATHGYFFPDIPMEDKDQTRFLGMDRYQLVQDPMLRSCLLLTGANRTLKGEVSTGENGLLSAAEASLLDLRETELVVLSACETGKGEVKNSEGVYGLRKAFSDAGAQNIIMSLWKVDDKVTQEFMSRFYQLWLNDKTTIREAFNKTQLEIKAKYPQPYYWGAFILVGE